MSTLLLILLACGAGEAPASPSTTRPAALVEVAVVRSGSLADAWTLSGEVRALERAELAAGATGSVVRAHVREGDVVAAGDTLMEIDPDLAAAQLGAARADRRRARAQHGQAKTRQERLQRVASGVLAADELDVAIADAEAAAAAVEAAEAQVRLAEAQWRRHQVIAPFPGVIAARHVDVGDWVVPGQRVLDLVQIEPVEVRVDAPASLAAAVAPGDAVQLPGGEGTVAAVVPALDPTTRTARLRVAPADGLVLVPGSAIDVTFQVQRAGGIVVPRDAVVPNGDEERVFRVVEGVAQALGVTTLATSADEVLVQSPELAVGDSLVVRGNERLRPDQAVTVAP